MKRFRELVVVRTAEGYLVCFRGERHGKVYGTFGEWSEEQIGSEFYRQYWREAVGLADRLNLEAKRGNRKGFRDRGKFAYRK